MSISPAWEGAPIVVAELLPSDSSEALADTAKATSAPAASDQSKASLRDYWYPVTFVSKLPKDRPFSFDLFGEPLVFFFDSSGGVTCLQDRCAHRAAPLSIGCYLPKSGTVECRYHGWQFGKDGACTRIPSLADDKIPRTVRVHSYPTTVREGLVWVWIGDPEKAHQEAGFPSPANEIGASGWVIVDQEIDLSVPFWSAIENLLDPAHLQFTHEGAQGKNVGPKESTYLDSTEVKVFDLAIPDSFMGEVNSQSTLKPVRYRLIFEPPVTVRLEVYMSNGWHFFQQHYCVPIGKKKTRMLLRSMRDWLTFIPTWMFEMANLRIVKQDQLVLNAQQVRINQGASRWNFPVHSDVLGTRFRRWLDDIDGRQKVWFKRYTGTSFKRDGGVLRGSVVDIEDLASGSGCTGGCTDAVDFDGPSHSMRVVAQVQDQAADVWPSGPYTPTSPWKTAWRYLERIYIVGSLFAIAVSVYVVATKR